MAEDSLAMTIVIPLKTGIHNLNKIIDSHLRGNDIIVNLILRSTSIKFYFTFITTNVMSSSGASLFVQSEPAVLST